MLLNGFFEAQARWQKPVLDSVLHLNQLAKDTAITLLTAMPTQFQETRRILLASYGVDFPIIAVDHAKGPLIAALAKDKPKVAFIDDLAMNHHSAKSYAPHVSRFHFMAYREFGGTLPPLPDNTKQHFNWLDLANDIRDHFSL